MNTHESAAQQSTTAPAKTNSKGEYAHFITEIETLINATNNLTGADLAQAKAKLNARIEKAKVEAEHLGADLAANTVRPVMRYVQRNPWTTLGAGAAVAGLVGFMIGRRA